MESSINVPTKLEQTTATLIGDKIVFAWLKRDTKAASPLDGNAPSGYLYSFDQRQPNAMPEQQGGSERQRVERQHRIMSDPDAVPLSCYETDGRLRWVCSTVPLNSQMQQSGSELSGVWVPNDFVREQMTNVALNPEYGNRSRQSLMRERAEVVCEEYSAWRNGDYYWYYIATYNVERNGSSYSRPVRRLQISERVVPVRSERRPHLPVERSA